MGIFLLRFKGIRDMVKTDTIAAIATALTNSGIGIVRISGSEAIEIADRVFHPKKDDKRLSKEKSYTVHYGMIRDGDQMIDEVLVLIMRGPHSYTAEDTVEIDCHGGVLVIKRILETVLKYGARLAEPGEFTKRAFLNGRIDLSQAEAVIDVINAKNGYALKSSVSQLRGAVSERVHKLREVILYEIAFIESALDDPEHISLDGYREKLLTKISLLRESLERLLKSFDHGRVLSEGIKTVILGKPNAGKSSLLNVLLGEDRAIVTEIAGTTRDTLEETIHLHGFSLNIVDTAGIRDTADQVEQIGVKRAIQSADAADLILYVVDGSCELDENDRQIMDLIRERNSIIILNKTDLTTVLTKEDLEKETGREVIPISAREQTGIDRLEQRIGDLFFSGEIDFNDEVMITNTRHKTAMQAALESICLVEESVLNEMPEDFYSIDLMNAYECLGTIVGEALEDDLINEIFSNFCMGK